MCWKYPLDFEPNTGREIIDAQSKFAWGFSYSINPFFPNVPTCAVRETASLGIMGATSGAPLKPLRDDSVLRALSSLRGLRGAPEVAPLCRETQSLGQQMKNW